MDEHGFREALDFARSNGQVGVWEVEEQSSLLAVWDDELQAVVALDEDQALPILAADREINRQSWKWRAPSPCGTP